jgi:hypothetical protein
MAWTVKISTLAVPTLEQFAPTVLLLHDTVASMTWAAVLSQTFLFIALLSAVSADRLLRKRF